MRKARSIISMRLALILSVVLLIGFLPSSAMAANAADISVTAVKDQAGVTAALNNLTSASVTATLVFAVYNPEGRLSYVKQYSVTAGAKASANQRFDFDFSSQPEHIIKLFVWDGIGFMPLCTELSSCLSIAIDNSGVIYDGIGVNVTAASGTTAFKFVMIDEFTKRGGAYLGAKTSGKWSHARLAGADVIIAYKPADVIGSALPDLDVTDLRLTDGSTITRILVSH